MTIGYYYLSVILQKLEYPKVKGQLVIFGATNWDLIGRKEVPKQQGIINLAMFVFSAFLSLDILSCFYWGDVILILYLQNFEKV